ncbi:MAG: hypothetical protein H0V22_10320 [Solirubrobacterales bacterium]|jgi:hypothetical protein|nr:hypothetical protein [Solirubrobacterales bacterium]
MYDVVYIDAVGSETQLANSIEDRRYAAELACRMASERGAGRVVLPGSGRLLNCVCVVPRPVVVGDAVSVPR